MALRFPNLLLVGCFLAAAQVLHADTIVLRSSLRSTGDAPILLRDVANLEGKDAIALGSVVVLEQPARQGGSSSVELSAEDVRTAITTARPQTRWGRIAFNGDTCAIRISEPKEANPKADVAPPPEKAKPAGPTWKLSSELVDDTVRGAVAARLVSFLKVEPTSVRLVFADTDNSLLDIPGAGRTLDIQPTGLGTDVPVLIRVFEGERVIAAGTVKVRVEQQQQVVVASRSLHRGDVVTKDVVLCEERWIAPGERYIGESSVVGSVVKNRLQVGQVFVEGDVEAAVMVKRGEIVNIACLTGSVVMNTRARALTQGREGETIDFVSLRNAKSHISARVVSPGQAVIQADEPEDHVFAGTPAPTPDPVSPALKPAPGQRFVATLPTNANASAPATAPSPNRVEVGGISVEKVTNNPDGTFVVQARTNDPRKPLKKMKFTPIDVP